MQHDQRNGRRRALAFNVASGSALRAARILQQNRDTFFQTLRAERGQQATFPCPSGIRFRLQMGCVEREPPTQFVTTDKPHGHDVVPDVTMNAHGVEPVRAAT